MFSKSKINEPVQKDTDAATQKAQPSAQSFVESGDFKASAPKPKPPASVISADLHITGNVKTTGDIQVEGTVEGDIRAHLLTIGETASVEGDSIHKTIAIESGAHFEGSVQRQEDPLTKAARQSKPDAAPAIATKS